MKILSNPLVIGALVLGGGYLLLKSGIFDSILGQDLAREYANRPDILAGARNNPSLRPGIRNALYGSWY